MGVALVGGLSGPVARSQRGQGRIAALAAVMTRDVPRLHTSRLLLTLPTAAAASQVADYFLRNQDHLAPWDPTRPEGFATEAFWRVNLEANRLDFQRGRSLRLFLLLRDGPVVGTANFTSIHRGALQACNLGYSIDGAYQGQGLMTEGLERALAYVFEELSLHRVEASYMPVNVRSGQLLRRLGFQVEGYSRDYLFIAGAWQDHLRAALTNPTPQPPKG